MKTSRLTELHFTVFLVSAVIMIGEIALMRDLALRFWSHLAWLAVSIALLGFGASGTMLILCRRLCKFTDQTLLFLTLLCCGLGFVGSLQLTDMVDINLMQMAWQPASILSLSLLELTLTLPFLFGGMCIALILTMHVPFAGSLYGASCVGSGLGALGTPLLLYILGPREITALAGVFLICNALLFAGCARRIALNLILATCSTALLLPETPAISEDKDLVQLLAMSGTKSILREQNPQGVMAVVDAPAFHAAPGLALLSDAALPPQKVITIDGHLAGILYLSDNSHGFRFMDDTTTALPFLMKHHNSVLIMAPAGNDLIGLALLHETGIIDAVTPNELLGNFLRHHATGATLSPQLRIHFATSRGYLQKESHKYGLIILPATGTDFAGLRATEPDQVLTLETVSLCLSSLAATGMITITTEAHLPPRESLRLVNLLAETLHRSGRPPDRHLLIIRNWATVTILASLQPLRPEQLRRARQFCDSKGFDLVWPTGSQEKAVNRYHVIPGEPYSQGVSTLLSGSKARFVADYGYNLSPPTDDRPFFHAFWKWGLTANRGGELSADSRPFRELGTMLLLAALGQSIILAFALIVLPLVPAIGLPAEKHKKVPLLLFFAAIGFGYMLIEVGMIQRLTSYLAHPVWAAATVLSAFLLFSGLGSTLATHFDNGHPRRHMLAIGFVICLSVLLIIATDQFLKLASDSSFAHKISLVYLGLSPLATAMGMVFPIGIRRLGLQTPDIVPWAWSINGFSSVIAALAAPLIAMQCGFRMLLWAAVVCYLAAGICARKITAPGRQKWPRIFEQADK